jgi:outer membrane receptor protein involved in Fe transport
LQGLYQNSTQEGLSTIQANYADDMLLPDIGATEPWHGEYQTGEVDLNPSEFDASLVGLTVDYDFGFATLTSVTSTQELQFVQSQDLTAAFAPVVDFFLYDSVPTTTSVIFVGDLGFDKLTQELRLTSTSSESFEWIVGAYYTDEEGHNIQRLDVQPPADFYFGNFPSNYDELSAFATGTFYFTPDFDMSLGVRYAEYSNDVQLTASGPLLAPIPLTTIDDEVTNYLLNARWRTSDNTSIYGRIATGYRPGGANFLLLDINGEPLTDPFFEADSLTSYELGVKGTTETGRFGYDLAAFYIDWQDYQIGIVRNDVQVAGNAEKAVSMGAEASLSFAATDALTFKAMVSYTNAELAADEPDLGGADGDQLPNSAEWQSAIDIDYRFDVGQFPGYTGISWRYKGDMPVGFDGYTDSNGTYWPPSSPRVTVDGYNMVDARAGMTVGPVDVSLYVTNLLDEWAYTNFGSSFDGPSLGTPTRPRTVGAVARFNFD